VRAINVVDQMHELVACDCFLIAFEHPPFRSAAEDADVVSGMQSERTEQPVKRETAQLPSQFFEMKHRRLNAL